MKWQTSVGKIEIEKWNFLYRKKRGIDKRTLDPFKKKTGIANRSYSKRCQKLVTDFGIEESFQMAEQRMREHHGVEISLSGVRRITLKHAKRAETLATEIGEIKKQPCKLMVLELDGEMVPLVEYESGKDRRKKKKNLWAELRIGVAQRFGEVNWKYATSFKSPDHLGNRVLTMIKQMGFNEQTEVHGVGDGALWMTEQGEKIAGTKYRHLVDLFHLCDYLAKAVAAWTQDNAKEVKRLKRLFENGHGVKALRELKRRQEKALDHEGLAACIKYIENRLGQFGYKEAKEKGLPIGSGKVESSHRSLIQKRLKRPGTWWLRENAEKMADLKAVRANGCWELLWQENDQRKKDEQIA